MAEIRLTKEVAELYLECGPADWLDLNQYTTVEDHVAEMLSTSPRVSAEVRVLFSMSIIT